MFWLTLLTLLVNLHRGEEVELETTKLPCSGNDCGTSSVQLSTSPLICFQCRHCNNATTSSLKIECKFSPCCYIAIVKDYGNEETFAVRGCVPANKSCIDGCKQIQLEHQVAHPNGTFGYCMTCKGNECNVNKYIPSELLTRRVYNGVNCYECRNCNKINATTPTVRCSQPECCYMAVLKNKLDNKTFAVRGCVKQNCSDTCRTIKDQHLQAHAEEMYSYCMTCGDGAGDDCNGNVYNPKLIVGEFDVINCFDCEDCKDIKLNTVKVRCGTKCCYSKIVMGKYQRGCAAYLNGGSCEDYCRKKTDGSCDSCSGNNCNSLRFPNDTIVANFVDSFKCYNCIDCDIVSSNTPRINCRSNCCTTVVKTVRGVSSTYRNCLGLEGDSCQQYCGYIAKSSKIDSCEICNGNECNGVPTNQTSLFKRQANVYCYSCGTTEDCELISLLTTTVYCSTRCCFAKVFRRDDGSAFARRGCAQIRSGCPCSRYCNKARQNHATLHPLSSNKFYCDVCTRSACNGQELDTRFRPRGMPVYNPKKCYSCIDCYSLNHDTETIECPDGCCYTAIWTEYGRKLLVRLCALLEDKRCDEYCRYLTERIADNTGSGSLHYCRTCCNEKCNSEPPPEYLEPIKEDSKDIHCYDCENCDKVSGSSYTVSCPSGCCYSQLKFGNDGKRITERHCAKIFPGTPCHKFCAHAEKVHKRFHPRGFVSYCKHCSVDISSTTKCNSEQLDTGVTGTTDRHITCYECQDCYEAVREPMFCPTGCCYTKLNNFLNKITMVRGCVKREDTPCADHCDIDKIKMLYSEPATKIHCKTCTNDACNSEKLDEQTTVKPPMSCHVCPESSDCKQLLAGSIHTEVCNSRCCYTKLFRRDLGDTLRYTSERGCAKLSYHQSCDKFLVDFTEELKNYTFCESHECNHIDMLQMEVIYDKTVHCYNCTNCEGTCPTTTAATPPEGKDCQLDDSACNSKCCYTAFNVDQQTLFKGCVVDDNKIQCTQDEITKWSKNNKDVSSADTELVIAQPCNFDSCNTIQLVGRTCYQCNNCDDKCMTGECKTDHLCKSKCCFSAFVVEDQTMHKGCMDGTSCAKDVVKNWFEAQNKVDPKIKTVEVAVCDETDKKWIDCNKETKDDFNKGVDCHKCEDCKSNCGTGCSDTESCKTKCCYTAIRQKDTGSNKTVSKGCVPNKEAYGNLCNGDVVEAILQNKYEDGVQFVTCNKVEKCNSQDPLI